MSDITMGIDPGKSGALAVIHGKEVWAYAFGGGDSIGKMVSEEYMNLIGNFPESSIEVYLENVHSFPGQGVASSFAFGRAFGEVIGALDALEAPYRLVSPQKWQKTILGLPKKKDGAAEHKRALKIECQRRFPSTKPTLKTCDAILIAEYGARVRL